MRKAAIARNTTETSIKVAVDLDGSGKYAVKTGVGSSTTCWNSCPGIR
jgi:imidazoleglycerol-phosphate dehydratase